MIPVRLRLTVDVVIAVHGISPQRCLSDCDRTEAASVLVSSLYFSDWSTLEAFASIAFPVSLEDDDCESADAAKLLAIAEALGSRRVSEASLDTSPEVVLRLVIITNLYSGSQNACPDRGNRSVDCPLTAASNTRLNTHPYQDQRHSCRLVQVVRVVSPSFGRRKRHYP